MAVVPVKYNLRNLVVRWRSTTMTALSIGLVVAVFIIIMSLANGLKEAFVSTGHPLNIMVLRQGSTAEPTSFISREAYRIIKYLPGIQKIPSGPPLVSAELTVLMNLQKIDDNTGSNVIIRGVSAESFLIHPQVKMVAGRIFQPGLREVIVSEPMAKRYRNMKIGDVIHIGKGLWTVVGHFNADRTAFDSEVWGNVTEVGADFDRETYSSVYIRAKDQNSINNLIYQVTRNPRLSLKAETEINYYYQQTISAVPIQVLGGFLAFIMSIGAIFAAINTMYASVANRTREIGTLRVFGFTPRNILISFILESLILSLLGGIIGCILSLPMDGIATHTANFRTFSEIAFHFRVTPYLMLQGLIFSLIIGVLGGIIPAFSAARRPVIAALREIE